MNKHQPLILHIDPEKNEALKGKNMPRCPACDHEQVQLLNLEAPVSEWRWKCRVCKTRFTKENGMPTNHPIHPHHYWPQHPTVIDGIKHCTICHILLKPTNNIGDDPSRLDCGGDCLRCMAEAGDPSCVEAMETYRLNVRPLVTPSGWTDEWRKVLARGGALLWWVRPDGVRVSPDGAEMYDDRAPLPPTTIVRVTREEHIDWRGRALAAEAKLAAIGETEKPGDHNYHGPVKDVVDPRTGRTVKRPVPDKIHERFHQSIGDVLSGKVMPEARRQMREAIDESDRTASKAAPMPGRALRLTHADIGLKGR